MFRLLFFTFFVFPCLSSCSPKLTPQQISISTDAPFQKLDPKFLSFAIDTAQLVGGRWWKEGEGSENGRGISAVEPFNFNRTKLDNLVSALYPAYIRIGGSEADTVFYAFNNETKPPKAYDSLMTLSQWRNLNLFVKRNKLELIFTLNAGPALRQNNEFNFSPLLQLVRDAKKNDYKVPVWEFGNEINGFWFIFGWSKRVKGKVYASEYDELRKEILKIQPEAKVAGPASAYIPIIGEGLPLTPKIMKDFSRESKKADILSWHFYPTQSERCPARSRKATVKNILKERTLRNLEYWAEDIEAYKNQYQKNSEIWLTETGPAQCGGQAGLSDRYISGLGWLDQVGRIANRGHKVIVRQTLAGSEYGLLQTDSLTPNPDYWNSVLWKQNMGSLILKVNQNDLHKHIRAYASCTPTNNSQYKKGAISLLVLNLDFKKPTKISLPKKYRLAKVLNVSSNSKQSRKVFVNNNELKINSLGNFESFVYKDLSKNMLTLAPLSYSFLVFPDAEASACKTL